MKNHGLAALAMFALTAAAPAPGERGAGAFERAMLDGQNEARAAAGVPPLTWDDRLAADAAVWADHIAETGRFEHSTWPRGGDPAGEGENLWMGSRGYFSYAQMVDTWVDEQRYFVDGAMPNLSTTGNWRDVGHYTQIIWRGTTRVGCALASGGDNDFVVCRYSSPGNVMGSRAR
ncbi:MAG: serine protease [Sphingomonas sp.]|uniref:CAP family protein n=1 Tax=Sphingomonas sp. TaxID=28214 RepID=UPI00120BB2FD|nr:CAP family protein [Sphingomonas sp.]THD37374.1 MAG: serine protease [Sphingomonas sp.]